MAVILNESFTGITLPSGWSSVVVRGATVSVNNELQLNTGTSWTGAAAYTDSGLINKNAPFSIVLEWMGHKNKNSSPPPGSIRFRSATALRDTTYYGGVTNLCLGVSFGDHSGGNTTDRTKLEIIGDGITAGGSYYCTTRASVSMNVDETLYYKCFIDFDPSTMVLEATLKTLDEVTTIATVNWLVTSTVFDVLDDYLIVEFHTSNYNAIATEHFRNLVVSGDIYYLSGYVYEEGLPVSRTVRVYARSTGELIASTTSDVLTGAFSLQVPDNTIEYYVVALDDEGDANDYNALIYDRLSVL